MQYKIKSAHIEIDVRHVEAFIRGDANGFHHVYTAYRQRVLTYCLYYLGNRADAKDAFQEVFLKVHTSREQLREPAALHSWLLLVTRSVCLNLLRSRKKTPKFVWIDNLDSDEADLKELSVGPVHRALDEEDLRLALSKLPPMYREAFLLREFEGYGYEEIAKLTNTTIANIQVRLTRAKSMLRKWIMQDSEIEKKFSTDLQRDSERGVAAQSKSEYV